MYFGPIWDIWFLWVIWAWYWKLYNYMCYIAPNFVFLSTFKFQVLRHPGKTKDLKTLKMSCVNLEGMNNKEAANHKLRRWHKSFHKCFTNLFTQAAQIFSPRIQKSSQNSAGLLIMINVCKKKIIYISTKDCRWIVYRKTKGVSCNPTKKLKSQSGERTPST